MTSGAASERGGAGMRWWCRGDAVMTRGAVSADMVDAVVLAVNGHVLRGAVRLARGYFANRRADKRTQRELDAPR